jgi:lysyl-tRNA synthetase class 2
VLEVETPVLSEAGNTDPTIESLITHFDGPVKAGATQRWMRTSPEYALKRLLSAGIGDCYELGRVFRNGEAGRRHNPEFTLLEWYRVGWDHRRLMGETASLIQDALSLVGRRASVRELRYQELFESYLNIDPLRCPLESIQSTLAGVRIEGDGLSRDDWLDLALTHRIEPRLAAHGGITLVYDYPASQAALARVRTSDPPVAERFEAYLGGTELANGYHELADPVEQHARFFRDLAQRQQRGLVQPPLDRRLLDAMSAGLPDCAGVAVGMDRLLMTLLDGVEIEAVLAFPFDRA